MGRSPEPVEEWEDARDDDTAVLLGSCDALDDLRAFFLLLHQRRFVTTATYRHFADCCDRVAQGLCIGRRNTALLRTRPPQ